MSQYSNFRDFYPYYLSEHSNLTCRRLHFAGTTGIVIIAMLVATTAIQTTSHRARMITAARIISEIPPSIERSGLSGTVFVMSRGEDVSIGVECDLWRATRRNQLCTHGEGHATANLGDPH